MQNTERLQKPGHYFALLRLLTSWRGGSAARSEKDVVETHVAGSFLHFVVYAFAFHLCLTSLSPARQLLLALPLAFAVWLFWLFLLYANSLLIRLLRACGLLRDLPGHRVQSILIGALTTLFACVLIRTDDWTSLIGAIWIGAVTLNLAAAAILALRSHKPRHRTLIN